jgi:hypothetical protein
MEEGRGKRREEEGRGGKRREQEQQGREAREGVLQSGDERRREERRIEGRGRTKFRLFNKFCNFFNFKNIHLLSKIFQYI